MAKFVSRYDSKSALADAQAGKASKRPHKLLSLSEDGGTRDCDLLTKRPLRARRNEARAIRVQSDATAKMSALV